MRAVKFNYAGLLVIIFLFISLFGFAQKPMSVVKSNKIVSIKAKKAYNYYKLEEKDQTILRVDGPGVLTIHTRVLLNEKDTLSNPFVIKYVIDKKKIIVKQFKELKKSTTFSSEGKPVSVAREFTIDIPPGKHFLAFNKKDTKQGVCILFSYKKEPDPVWIDKVSSNQLEEVKLLYSDQDKKVPLSYYRISDKQSFKVNVKLGDQLRILVRPEFRQDEYSKSRIRLAVKYNGKVLNTYTVAGKRAEKVRYQNEARLIPGINSEIYLKVPKPKQGLAQNDSFEYELVLQDAQKTALIRVSVDDKTAKNKKSKQVKAIQKKK